VPKVPWDDGHVDHLEASEPPSQQLLLKVPPACGLSALARVQGSCHPATRTGYWQPDFINNFTSYLTGAQDGQPAFVKGWINFWINIVKVDPHVFAHGVAVAETLIAVALIFGVVGNLTNIGGILLTVVIWTTAEGFGGPYAPGSADIGSAIIYALVFVGLFLSSAGLYLGFDRWVTPRLGRFGFLASGPFIRPHFIRRLGHKENVAV
jgi:uncharacterized membrane protein YphA (DoxX/SURF4 family)